MPSNAGHRTTTTDAERLCGYVSGYNTGIENDGFPSESPTPHDALPMGLLMAEKYRVKLVDSIQAALCYDAETDEVGTELAVDGILAIGEHGNYPINDKGQRMYPRRYFFEQICGVLANSPKRHACPIFTDKHLAVTWDDALFIYNRGKELGLTHMAGSSVPVCFWRDPWLEHPIGTPLEEALVLSYGDLEAYGYHGLEALQAMIERRPGGEAGISSVQCLEGDQIWAAAAEGRWLRELGESAMAVVDLVNPGATNSAPEAVPEVVPPLEVACGDGAALFLIEFADGFRASLLHCQGEGNCVAGWAYAARVTGQAEPVRCSYNGNEAPNYPPFSYLSLNIERMFLTGDSPYPVERTLLVTGALDVLMDSKHQGNVKIATPQLEIAYPSPTTEPIRPTNPRPKV